MIRQHKNESQWCYAERRRYDAIRKLRVNRTLTVTPHIYPTLVALQADGLIKFNATETETVLTVAGWIEANRIGLR